MKLKRLISLLMALVLTASLFTACSGGDDDAGSSSKAPASSEAGGDDASEESAGGDESSEDASEAEGGSTAVDGEGYQVNYLYFVAQEGANQNKVNQAVDELAQKELNMTVNMIPMTMGTYNSQISMMLAAGEPLDIFPSFSNQFSSYIESQYVVNMADYLDDMKDAQEILGEDFNCGYIGDFLIGLSQMKERAYPTGIVVRKDIFDELGYKVEDFSVTTDDYSTFSQITDLFAAVKEKYPDMVCNDGTSMMGLCDGSYIDNLGDDFGVLENYGQTTTITNWFESDQWRSFCEIAREWFTKGYLSQDIAVNQDSGELKIKAGNTFSFVVYVKPNTNIEKLAQTGYETEFIPIGKGMKNTNAVNALMISVASAAEDPQKACQFMNWTYASGDFNDLINWGIEGEDWVETENGQAAYPEGVDASSVGYHNDYGWAYPNQFAAHAWDGNPEDIWDQYKEYNANLLKSKAFGFTFDPTPVSTEIAQLNSIRDQYWKDLAFGAVEIDEKLKEFNDALYAAGLQTVMDEKQRQLDEWLANQ